MKRLDIVPKKVVRKLSRRDANEANRNVEDNKKETQKQRASLVNNKFLSTGKKHIGSGLNSAMQNKIIKQIAAPVESTFKHQFGKLIDQKAQNKKSHKKVFTSLLIGFLLPIILIIATAAVQIYVRKSDDKFVRFMSRSIPFPVARIGSGFSSDVITYQEYLIQLDSNRNIYQQIIKNRDIAGDEIKSDEEIKKDSLDDLINRAIDIKLAKDYKISYQESEVDKEIEQAISRAGGRDNFLNTVEAVYKKNLDDIKKDTEASLLKSKLEQYVISDQSINSKQYNLANSLLIRLNKGENFEDLARTFSEDSITASKGGDMGLLDKSTVSDDALKEYIFNSPIGLINKVITSKTDGYHLVKIVEKVDDKVRASQILIKHINFEQWLEEQHNNYKKSVYLHLQ